jgi:hypothetical protein
VFFTGGNSSCQAHICQHYNIYKEHCKERNIPENHHTLPQQLFGQMKGDKTGGSQLTLDGVLRKPLDVVKTYQHKGATCRKVRNRREEKVLEGTREDNWV